MLEPAEEALRREIQEELGEEIGVDRLVWVAENFFEYQGICLPRDGAVLSRIPAKGQ